jgi:hypothetical protein
MEQWKNDTDRQKLKNVKKNQSHRNSVHDWTLTGLKFNLGHHSEKPHYNILLCFWKLISNIILWFGSYSYLHKACIHAIHLPYIFKMFRLHIRTHMY